MATNNATIIAKAYLSGTNDFQQRIPDPTQAGIAATEAALFDPMNGKYLNEFIDTLVNRIGLTIFRGKSWENKLKPFKGQKLNYGSTIQEIAPEWVKAHSYDDASQTLLKMNRPEVQAWYHSQNRKDRYDITINYEELRTAFTSEMGINNLLAKIMLVPANSDEYDEYKIMLQLISFYENNWGFYKQHLSAMPTDKATGEEFLTQVRTYAKLLPFPSTLYNAQKVMDIPVFAKPEELVLLTSPTVSANIDVHTLANVFNQDKAQSPVPEVVIDEFPIPNAAALLTTKDFFVCHDTVYQTTNFFNGENLGTNYWLHHWGAYSVSPFVPSILFTIDAGTVPNIITETVTGVTIAATSATCVAGGTDEITVTGTGTLSESGTEVTLKPDSAMFKLSAADGDGKNVELDYKTYIDRLNVLHIAPKVPVGTVITIAGISTYVNPSGATTKYSGSTTVTVATATS